jgi:hypothetical protein
VIVKDNASFVFIKWLFAHCFLNPGNQKVVLYDFSHITKIGTVILWLNKMSMIKFRLLFMLFGIANLFIGMSAGLIRMGWNIQVTSFAIHHGAIMVGGFLGTLILLEKVIPLKRNILLVFPLINALSLLVVVPGLYLLGQAFLLIGALGLLIVFFLYLMRQPRDLSLLIMMMGAFCQIGGHVMLLSKQFYPMAFPWWMAFILFVIVGERVELSKFLPVTARHKMMLVGFLSLFLMGLFLPFHGVGKYLSGLALILISTWLMRHDVISVAVKKDGLTRFSGIALLVGCINLLFTGLFLIGLPDTPFAYDAIVHTFFIGFAFTMIFAHGPIILPGVLGFSFKPYHHTLYIPLITLVSSLFIRLLADLSIIPYSLRLWSGWISFSSILFYFMLLAVHTIRNVRHAKAI